MAALLGATNYAFVALADILFGPARGDRHFGSSGSHLAWTVGCLLVALGVVLAFRRSLSSQGVVLTHLGDVLVVLTRVRLWASRHRVAAGAVFAGLLFVGGGVLLYWVESFHAREYGTAPRFEGPREFVTWLFVFVSSGYEKNTFPSSILGNVLAAALALGSIAALVLLVRLSTGSSDFSLRDKIARGEIPSSRLVIVNGAAENVAVVGRLVSERSRFVTVATRDPRLEAGLGLRPTDRLAVVRYEDSAAELVGELHLDQAQELVLLSRSVSDDFDNLALLSALDTVAAAGGRVGAADDAPPTLPPVVLQLHGQELPALVENRLSDGLLAVLARPPFHDVVGRFLVAEAAGLTDDLRRLYATPFRERGDAGDDAAHRVRLRGVGVALGVEPMPASGFGGPGLPPAADDVRVVGLQVLVGDRPDWRSVATRRADEVHRPATGQVVVGPAGSLGEALDNRPRATVHVVGGGGLAQHCALGLVAAGVADVRLLVAPDEPLLPRLGQVDGLTVERCGSELEAGELLAERDGGDDAVLVVENLPDRSFASERLLERLSIARLHEVDAGRPVRPLYVCCRGADRAQRLTHFVVDKVIDATWAESSYFTVFSTVYFDVLHQHEDLAEWLPERQVAVAHRIASSLCHLEIVSPSDVWFEVGTGRQSAASMTGAMVVSADRSTPVARGPLVGVVHFAVEHDPAGDPVVAVDVEVPPADERIRSDDLLVGLPCL
jgi:hypothetical protein